jgi:stress response protein SCP2
MELQRDSKVEITGETVICEVGWQAKPGYEIDVSAFLLNDAREVRSDADFVFYNQLKSACGAVSLQLPSDDATQQGSGTAVLTIQTGNIDPDVERLVIAVSLYCADSRSQDLGQVRAISMILADDNRRHTYDASSDVGPSEAFLFGELVRDGNGGWYVRIEGESYAGGLGDLARIYGVDVDDDGNCAQTIEQGVQVTRKTFEQDIDNIEQALTRAAEQPTWPEGLSKDLTIQLFNALGYGVADADDLQEGMIVGRTATTVDLVALESGKPAFLVEYKPFGTELAEERIATLYNAFVNSEAEVGVLSNGRQMWWFSDTERDGKMDALPFLKTDLAQTTKTERNDLWQLSKPEFSRQTVVEWATNKRHLQAQEAHYRKELYQLVANQLDSPTDAFVRFFAEQVYDGPMTAEMLKWFAQEVRDQITTYLGRRERVMLLEQQGFAIVKSVMRECMDVDRLELRSVQSYCGILLDFNNRRPICRLHVKRPSAWYLGLFDRGEIAPNGGRIEDKIRIERLDDIHYYADRLRATLAVYGE